jgi:hypothetical protein
MISGKMIERRAKERVAGFPGWVAATLCIHVIASTQVFPKRYDLAMKTTLDIKPEVYEAAEKIARTEHRKVDEVLSVALRRALIPDSQIVELEKQNGFDVFPARNGSQVTVATVHQLCQEEGL